MSLTVYKKKRNFSKTSEPIGVKMEAKSKLHFVVQKHDATNLHYDFRLEMNGVLKSWAVPKGPSMNPDDRHLAIMVEDHPFEYKDFEGNIPEGNYGAGSVIVWDSGTYSSIENSTGKDEEKILLQGLKKGHVTFILHGKKLKGEFALVKFKGDKDNQWLLIKKNDEFASTEDILKKDKSVLSTKTIESLNKKYAKSSKKNTK
jgi:bifunctional non-homologous end joining protein LigD